MIELLKYPHEAIFSTSSKTLGLHLWYLSEVLVGLALFDSRVSVEMKRLMDDPAPDHLVTSTKATKN